MTYSRFIAERRIAIAINKVEYANGVFYTIAVLTDLDGLEGSKTSEKDASCPTTNPRETMDCGILVVIKVLRGIVSTWKAQWEGVIKEINKCVGVDVSRSSSAPTFPVTTHCILPITQAVSPCLFKPSHLQGIHMYYVADDPFTGRRRLLGHNQDETHV